MPRTVSTISPEMRNRQCWRDFTIRILNLRSVPYLYLCLALPAVLTLSFLVPPTQTPDESRHFLRAVQFSQGDWIAAIDPNTNLAGGVLPNAVFDFVRQSTSTDFLQGEESFRTIRARLHALGRASKTAPPLTQKRFGAFPTPTVYPPDLYIPQLVGIRVAKLFSDKVYVWFYSSRVFNATTAVLIVFWALLIVGPERSALLMVPAMLPMTLYQFCSISDDASLIALSILFAALCVCFWSSDGTGLRSALILCLALIVMGKPVYVLFGLLLLTSYRRIGWRKSILFSSVACTIAGVCYLYWSYLIRGFLGRMGEHNGQNPAAQVKFILSHPIKMPRVLLASIHQYGPRIAKELIGVFGWLELSLPPWFEYLSVLVIVGILILVLINYKKVTRFNLLIGISTVVSIGIAIFMAGYILWTPPGAPTIALVQGRYFIPAMAIIAILAPPLSLLGTLSRVSIVSLSVGYFALSAYTTVRIVDHYYFPQSTILGRNIQNMFRETPADHCPATVDAYGTFWSWFQFVVTGRALNDGKYRVLFATDDGTILSESDPAFIGAFSPLALLSNSHGSIWRIRIWRQNRAVTAHLWFVQGNSACRFGPSFTFRPYILADTQSVPVSEPPVVLIK